MSLANDQITITKTEGEVRVVCRACSRERKKKGEKCLAINAKSGAYNCHHCGDSGIIVSHRTMGSNSNEPQYERPSMDNVTPLSDKMLDWFKGRGISSGTLLRNKVTQSTEWMPQVSDNRNVICFNYYREGELINIKYRDGEKNFRQTKNAEKIFYGLDDIKDKKEVFIVEGEMDKLALDEIGITNCISVPDGAPNPGTKNYDNKFSYLDNCWEYFEEVEKIFICSDNDTNGRVLLEEISRRLGRERCYIVEFPKGIKDANQMLVELGNIALTTLLEAAQPYPIEGIFTVEGERSYMMDVFNNGKKKGLTTGYQVLDNHYKLRTGELDIWTGVPGSGKTMMALQVMLNSSVLYGWKWGLFSPENYPVGDLFDILAEMYIGNTSDIDKDNRMSSYEYESAMEFLNEHFYAIYPEDDFSLENVLSKFKHLVMRYGIKGCLLDPFNQLDHKFNGKDESTYIGESLTKIRRFEQLHDLKFIIVAHPRKMDKDESGVHYKIPTAYDISGSSNWFNKADNVVAIHRMNPIDPFDTSVRFNVQKVKFQKLVGIPGEQILKFDRRSNRYLDMANSCPLDKVSITHTHLFATTPNNYKQQYDYHE